MARVKGEQVKLHIAIEISMNVLIAQKQLYRNEHTLLENDHLGKAEANTQNTQFASKKELTITDSQGQFRRLV